MMELFMNDNYKLLKLMYDNQTIILNKKVVPLTQLELSLELKFSKMKTNALFSELQKEGYIVQEARGKYSLTDKSQLIIKEIEQLEKKLD